LPAQPIRRIDVPVREVRWSDSGELVAILSDQSFYVLRFARDGASTLKPWQRRGTMATPLVVTYSRL